VREADAADLGRPRDQGAAEQVTAAPAPVSESAAPILRLRGIGRRFGGVQAVREVDLDVPHGERRAVLGPNGAGKTTLFNVIAGEFPPTAGSVEFRGADITRLPSRRRARLGLARTFQTSRLFLGLTVEDNLFLALTGVGGGRLRPFHVPVDRERRARARAAAARAAIDHRLDACVGDLAHGEQRQLEIAMALAVDPTLLMLDEPAAGLARAERQLLTQLLLDLPRDVTLLLIEHDMDVALTVADRVTMMHEGRVIVEGTPVEIRANELVHDLYLGTAHR
jgi:branched-chain amino acid transport system ATP-binding protein